MAVRALTDEAAKTTGGDVSLPADSPVAPQHADGRWTPKGKKRPQARLKASDEPQADGQEGDAQPADADWASLFGDLSRPSAPPEEDPVEWRVHDKTHLEFAIDYPLESSKVRYQWEAYFFVPESFRLDSHSYSKKEIYEDLHSYVRLAVPSVGFSQLPIRVGPDGVVAPLGRLAHAIESSATDVRSAVREVRYFACLARASGLSAMRALERAAKDPESDPTRLRAQVTTFSATCGAVAAGFREVLRPLLTPSSKTDLVCDTGSYSSNVQPQPVDDLRVAARWADEDLSLVLEALCASLALELSAQGKADYADILATRAVAEARHRRTMGYPSVASSEATTRDIEHLEWRRHVLKRFTSSVLWLSLEVREGAAWVLHFLYAVAAAVAMTFALAATFQLGRPTEQFFKYAILIVVSYAMKDRIKAFLQERFAKWISKRYPDRRWTLRDRERARDAGSVRERAGFLGWSDVPRPVLDIRRTTREHAMEEQARPESVLFHDKIVDLNEVSTGEVYAPMLTEIFRLNVGSWLAHADDPNRRIAFADPADARIYSATARRVYNINVAYRLRKLTEGQASKTSTLPFHRIRLVVSRKGIERIESIS